MATFIELPASGFLDYCGARITAEPTVEAAYGIRDARPFDGSRDPGFNLGLMLRRNQDPGALLSANWAERQRILRQRNDTGTLWATYGADPATYAAIAADIDSRGVKRLTDKDSNYVIGPEPRMLWVEINSAEDFQALFNTQLLYSPAQKLAFWNGNLSLPAAWGGEVAGLWIDVDTVPPASNQAHGAAVTLAEGPQSQGSSTEAVSVLPPQLVAGLYNFPLAGEQVRTGAIGLIEPGVGSYLPDDPSGRDFETRLREYLATINQTQLPGAGGVEVQGRNGQSSALGDSGSLERSLDVGVSAGVNPNSRLILYNGSGQSKAVGNAKATVFTAAQSAIWDLRNDPAVTSNSFGDPQSMTPGSPFDVAYRQMFLDAVLRNQTTVIALGDGGSGNQIGNGLTNVETNITQSTNLLVGGTSLSSLSAAAKDDTLSQPFNGSPSLLSLALAGDPATLWSLMASGLSQLPSLDVPDQPLVEAVWNDYLVKGTVITGRKRDGNQGYLVNSTSSGGVDPTQATPSYQRRYGLSPVTSDLLAQAGRGVPDVALNAGGNLEYLVPRPDMRSSPDWGDYGTSAAAPMWAGLLTQINTIFADQGLPRLGYINDLLYTAAVVSPGAFNDISIGNNTSSYTKPGLYSTINNNGETRQVQPTGYGYEAGPDYDLITGLGSPNGTLLAIALTNIAHAQFAAAPQPGLLAGDATAELRSGARQSLLWQVSSREPTAVSLAIDRQTTVVGSDASDAYVWTSRLAQQSLQQDFDPALLALFDGQAQGALVQTSVDARDSVSVAIDAQQAGTPQLTLSNDHGFVDFVRADAAVRAARAVCVATPPAEAPAAPVLVRLRQNGVDDQALFLYRVDDLIGTIAGLAPGEPGYDAAMEQRRYAFSDGQQQLAGGGFGSYSQGLLLGVQAGDLIAMGLRNLSSGHTFLGFAEANEGVSGQKQAHLWNYGFNTFGFEDTFGGGDRDFQDTVFQLDFGSASGSQLLL